MLLPCDYLSYVPAVPKVSREQRCQKRPPNHEVSGDDLSADEEEFPSVSRRLILESTDNIVESDALAVENERIEQQGKDGIESDEVEIRSDVDETPDVMEEQNAAMVAEDVNTPAPVQDIEDEVIENNRPPWNTVDRRHKD